MNPNTINYRIVLPTGQVQDVTVTREHADEYTCDVGDGWARAESPELAIMRAAVEGKVPVVEIVPPGESTRGEILQDLLWRVKDLEKMMSNYPG